MTTNKNKESARHQIMNYQNFFAAGLGSLFISVPFAVLYAAGLIKDVAPVAKAVLIVLGFVGFVLFNTLFLHVFKRIRKHLQAEKKDSRMEKYRDLEEARIQESENATAGVVRL